MSAPVRRNDIAVVGYACRLPQAADAEAFWHLLREGRDAVTDVPRERWDSNAWYDPDPSTGRKTNSRWGGFLDRIEDFDAWFFNIAPREARLIDPQQRLALELAWETIEHAGRAGDDLSSSQVGVFVGCSNNSYYERILPVLTPADYSAGIGNQNTLIANRISFFLNLQGPSLIVDTLCSASLVAMHLACRSLIDGECDLALAGGVNVLLSPDYYVGMSRMRAHAPDGRCKTFDHRANGIVLGEGAGFVLLKPLGRALDDGDTVHGVIRGSAVNHGGHANGLTAPNPLAQAALIRKALNAAEVRPETVSYVEAHGTGTALGDPVEAEGLAKAFGAPEGCEPWCGLGSAKTNIGHLECAAGIAGFVKLLLALRHRELPPLVHFEQPNPMLRIEGSPFRLVTKLEPWRGPAPLRAGISSFGMGGTNAHLVVEEAPAPLRREKPAAGPQVVPLSAKSPASLQALLQRYAAFAAGQPAAELADVAFTLQVGRGHFAHRFAAVVSSLDELRGELDRAALGPATARERAPHVAFVFSGRWSDHQDAARQIYAAEPIFRATVDRLDDVLAGDLETPLVSLFTGDDGAGVHDDDAAARAALFALHVGLADLWSEWGAAPEAVLGEGLGEYAAACVAGVLEIEDAARLVACSQVPAAFCAQLDSVALHPPELLFVSGLSGRVAEDEVTQPDYWRQAAGQTPRTRQALDTLDELGCDVLLEIGPTALARELAAGHGLAGRAVLVPSLRQGLDARCTMLAGLAALYRAGVDVRWHNLTRTGRLRRVPLPGYVFERRRHWVDVEQPAPAAARPNAAPRPAEPAEQVHPVLGRRHDSAGGAVCVFETVLSAAQLTDRKRAGEGGLLTADGFAELARIAGGAVFAGTRVSVANLALHAALPLGGARRVQYVVARAGESRASFQCLSALENAPGGRASWQLHASAQLTVAPETRQPATDGLLHELRFVPIELNGQAPAEPGSVLLFADAAGVCDALAARLTVRGFTCTRVRPAERFGRQSDGTWGARPGEPADVTALLAQAFPPGAPPLTRVVHAWPLDTADEGEAATIETQRLACGGLLGLVSALAETQPQPAPRLVVLTRRGQATEHESAPVNALQSLPWGLARAVAVEHRNLDPLCIDIDGAGSLDALELLVAGTTREDQVALREGRACAARLVKAAPDAAEVHACLDPRADAAYVVTGLGIPALRVARSLVERGARRLTLAGRVDVERLAETARVVEELREAGASVRVVAVDLTRREELARVLDAARDDGPLAGIVHTAGASGAGVVRRLDARRFEQSLAPKVAGALHLDALTRDDRLDFMVFFSSMVGALGTPGHAHHLTGQAFLDALAHRRRARGLPALSVNWSPWSRNDAPAEEAGTNRRTGRVVLPLAADTALAAFWRVLGQPRVQVGVLAVDWDAYAAGLDGDVPPLFAELCTCAARQRGRGDRATVLAAVERREPAERRRALVEYLQIEVAALLGMPAEPHIDPRRSFLDLGMDSLVAIELRDRLYATLGQWLPATLVYDHRTIEALAAHLTSDAASDTSDASQRPASTTAGGAPALAGPVAAAPATPEAAAPLASTAEVDDIEGLLAQVESMSDEQALRTLESVDGR